MVLWGALRCPQLYTWGVHAVWCDCIHGMTITMAQRVPSIDCEPLGGMPAGFAYSITQGPTIIVMVIGHSLYHLSMLFCIWVGDIYAFVVSSHGPALLLICFSYPLG